MQLSELELDIKVKNLAKSRDMSMRKLCQKIDMTENGLNAAFKNNTLKVETLAKISQVLGVPVSYFFNESQGSVNIVSQGIGNNSGVATQNFNSLGECIERVRGLEKQVELLREINDMLKANK